jgi:hypothetical protein
MAVPLPATQNLLTRNPQVLNRRALSWPALKLREPWP